jgi:hypothetical protein
LSARLPDSFWISRQSRLLAARLSFRLNFRGDRFFVPEERIGSLSPEPFDA